MLKKNEIVLSEFIRETLILENSLVGKAAGAALKHPVVGASITAVVALSIGKLAMDNVSKNYRGMLGKDLTLDAILTGADVLSLSATESQSTKIKFIGWGGLLASAVIGAAWYSGNLFSGTKWAREESDMWSAAFSILPLVIPAGLHFRDVRRIKYRNLKAPEEESLIVLRLISEEKYDEALHFMTEVMGDGSHVKGFDAFKRTAQNIIEEAQRITKSIPDSKKVSVFNDNKFNTVMGREARDIDSAFSKPLGDLEDFRITINDKGIRGILSLDEADGWVELSGIGFGRDKTISAKIEESGRIVFMSPNDPQKYIDLKRSDIIDEIDISDQVNEMINKLKNKNVGALNITKHLEIIKGSKKYQVADLRIRSFAEAILYLNTRARITNIDTFRDIKPGSKLEMSWQGAEMEGLQVTLKSVDHDGIIVEVVGSPNQFKPGDPLHTKDRFSNLYDATYKADKHDVLWEDIIKSVNENGSVATVRIEAKGIMDQTAY